MKGERLEVMRGSGNVFRDLGYKQADVHQLKAILAAEIIKALDRQGLSVRAAERRTGIAAADFSRIRNANLGRFTVDRLMTVINRLGSHVEVRIHVRRAGRYASEEVHRTLFPTMPKRRTLKELKDGIRSSVSGRSARG